MYTGDSLTLKVTNAPGKLTWKSSNKNVATINSKGKVVAKRTGKQEFLLAAEDGVHPVILRLWIKNIKIHQ